MENFFFTFGCNSPYAKQYVRIEAKNEEEARLCMMEHHGQKWAFCYTEARFAPQPSEYGLTQLAFIHTTPYGTKRSVNDSVKNAAPELLEALKNSQVELRTILSSVHLGPTDRGMIKLRIDANSIAIMKAEGTL